MFGTLAVYIRLYRTVLPKWFRSTGEVGEILAQDEHRRQTRSLKFLDDRLNLGSGVSATTSDSPSRRKAE